MFRKDRTAVEWKMIQDNFLSLEDEDKVKSYWEREENDDGRTF